MMAIKGRKVLVVTIVVDDDNDNDNDGNQRWEVYGCGWVDRQWWLAKGRPNGFYKGLTYEVLYITSRRPTLCVRIYNYFVMW